MGKIRNRKPIDMMGVEFQTWKVISLSTKKGSGSNAAYWLCQCQVCGAQKELCGSEIRAGRTGICKHKNLQNNTAKSNTNKKYFITDQSRSKLIKDETGNVYGLLTVKSFSHISNSQAYWVCECKCGNMTIVKGNALRTKSIASCGCLASRKEEEIADILKKEGIAFVRQHSFSDLQDIRKLRFDFAIFSNENQLIGLIEYQGIQHYIPIKHFGDFEVCQKHDQMKREYCILHKIPLLELNKDNCLYEDIKSWYGSIT